MVSQFVTIDILGKTYTLQTNADASRVSKVVEILKQEVARVNEELSQEDPHKAKDVMVLLLAALNFAGLSHEISDKLQTLKKNIEIQTEELLPLVESSFRSNIDRML